MKVLKYISAMLAALACGVSFAQNDGADALVPEASFPDKDSNIVVTVKNADSVENPSDAALGITIEEEYDIIRVTVSVDHSKTAGVTEDDIRKAVSDALRNAGYAGDLTVPVSACVSAISQIAENNAASDTPATAQVVTILIPKTPEMSVPAQVFPDNTIITSEEQ